VEPTSGTRVIQAYEALSGALRSVLEPAGVQVLDGPRVAEDLQPDVLLVGYSPEAALTATHERAGLGARITESIELRCLFSTASGDTELSQRRARVQEVMDLISAMCALQRPLAGAVDRLGFGESLDLQQEQTRDGAVAELSFSLTGRILR
jgi:hypothetical protein